MKKKNLFYLFMGLLLAGGFQSCSDDDDPKPVVNAVVKEVEIDATAYDKWIYFSFEKGMVVGNGSVEEKRAGTDWDIAFHRWDIRTNSGTSGSGKGGTLKAEGKTAKTGWDALTVAPDAGYSVDENIAVMKKYGMPPTMVNVGGSSVITGGEKGDWVIFSHANGPSYNVTNQIYLVKTATGKYVKVWLKQYTNAEKKGGHITMKYAYQADGSTKLN
ncbi:hypothetical protein EMN47_16395 [Prolixibacteraceae bacterium JC049]|nr:hypothetical protein [Prolixibacteraceae bacterium JC049]